MATLESILSIRRAWSRRIAAGLALAWLVGAPSAPAIGDDPASVRFRRVSTDDGLSQNAVNCIAQDTSGFMWFGTQDGLNRYDGYEFSIFKNDPSDARSLSHNFVWSLHVDSKGRLWVGTGGGGLDRWDPDSETFVHARGKGYPNEATPRAQIRSIDEARDGTIWLGTEGGLAQFDPDTGAFRWFVNDPADANSLAHDQVRVVHSDSRGAVWIGTDAGATEVGGLDRLDPRTGTFTHYRARPSDPRGLSSHRVRTITEDRQGRLWVGTYEGGLNRLDDPTGPFLRFRHANDAPASLSHDRIRSIVEDRDGTIWVGTDVGLNRWIPETDRFEAFRYDAGDAFSLSSDRVLAVAQDRGGVLWVATQAGLNAWNPVATTFAHYRQSPGDGSTLSSNIVTSFSEDQRRIVWIGTFAGLNALDRTSGRWTVYRHDAKDPGSLGDDRVMSLLHDRTGTLWVGTFEGGLSRLLPGAHRFERFVSVPDDPTTLGANGVTSIHEDRAGVVWIGTYRGGLSRFDRATTTFRRYRHDPANARSLSHDKVMVVSSDRDGFIWVGTDGGGLSRLDPRTEAFDVFRNDPTDPESLGSNQVWAIAEGRDGTLWVGTQVGLNRWSREDRLAGRVRFTHYTEHDGLPNGMIYGILEDHDGRLWLSSNRGISRFDVAESTFTDFDTTRGLQGSEFNLGAAYASPAGEMFFGGNNGFNVFDPAQVVPNRHVPPVVITGFFKLGERAATERPLWRTDGVVLSHQDYAVSFEFAALDFTTPRKNRYAYKLEGFDRDWIEADDSRRATYTNLPPGTYTLRVRGSNNDAVWNEEGSSLLVVVLPPWWRSWWAYGLYGLALAGVVASYMRAQKRKLEREAEYSRKLEREVAERTRELDERNQQLAEASLTDPLTGLRNRRYMMTYLREDIAVVDRRHLESRLPNRLVRTSPPDFLFIMLDLDDFKPINDNYGHEAGDATLKAVRDVLRRTCRETDTLIRWGGDEFLVVCKNTDRAAAESLADRIRLAIAETSIEVGEGRKARVGCSLGFAFYPFLTTEPGVVGWERVLMIADRALYLAKAQGKGAWAGVLGTKKQLTADLVPGLSEDPVRLADEGYVTISSNVPALQRPAERPASRAIDS